MMADMKTCKLCNSTPDNYLIIDKYKVEDFSNLVRECSLKREKSGLKSSDNVETNPNRKNVITWLVENASHVNIYFWDLENVIEECVECSNVEQLLTYLKHYGVQIKSPNSYDECNVYNALLTAAKCGTPDIISWIIQHGASTNCFNKDYENPVQIAVKYGNLKNLIRLVNLGADVSNSNILVTAAQYNHFDILKWVFDNNLLTDVNARLEALHKAIEVKHYDIIEWLVDNNVSVTMTTYNKSSAIHYAGINGNVVLLKWLLKKGALLFTKDQNRKTVLHYASEHGHAEMLQWLVLHGGDIFERIVYGYTPLHLAASKGHFECVKFLVHKGCEVNSKDRNGTTVLYVGAESKNLEIVKFLVQHGADFNAIDDFRNTILHSAVSNLNMVKWLVQIGCDPHKKNNEQKSVLSLAAQLFLHDTAKWLLEIGINANDMLQSRNYWFHKSHQENNWSLLILCLNYILDINVVVNGETLLHSAAPYLDAVKLLVTHKANVNSVDSFLNTPLHCAVRCHAYKCANYLIDNGSDSNLVNQEGDSVLHLAACCCDLNLIQRISERADDVNLKNNKGESALQRSVCWGFKGIIEVLIAAGCDVNGRNGENESVLYSAACHCKWDTVKLLIASGADINTHRRILHQAVSTEDIELVAWLIQHGASVSNVQVEGESSMLPNCGYIQDENKKLPLIKLLVEKGVDINGKNDYGETILHCSTQCSIVLDYLLENGINVNIQGVNRRSALHITIQRYSYDTNFGKDMSQRLITIKKLIKAGANVNVKDDNGRSPLYYAAQSENMSVVKLLVLHGADIDSKDNEGTSILHATPSGEIALFLYEKGANINARDISGVSVLQNALRKRPFFKSDTINIVTELLNRQIHTIANKSSLSDNVNSITNYRYLKYIEVLIENVKNINELDNNGRSLLHYAVEEGNIPTFLKLIEKGAHIYSVTKNGDNILHIAAAKNEFFIAKYIVDNFDVNSLMKLNKKSENPLHLAVTCNTCEIVKLLVNYVDINCKNNEGLTVLHVACQVGNLDIVKLLVSKGANIHESGAMSFTPVQYSVKHCRLKILDYLVEYCGDKNILQQKTVSNETLLHIAVKFGKFNNVPNKIVNYLLENNLFEINTLDDNRNTALHYACGTFMVDIITMLVERGANINLKNIDGNTPFHIAAKTGSIDVINFLLEKGGDPCIRNKKGNTPVHIAASHAKINPVECLLQRGADLRAKNRKGVSLIHQLAIAGGTHLFKYLLENFESTDFRVENNKKQTPLVLAMKFPNNKNVDNLLMTQNINSQDVHGNTALHEACRFNNINFVDKLMAHEADVNIKNKKGDTPVHLAAMHCGPLVMAKLLAHCQHLNILNNLGCNILLSAASGNNVGVIQMLLRIMDKFSKTYSGNTILHIASKNKDTAVFQWLIENCSDLMNERNNIGETVLHCCIKLAHQNINIIELLISNNADVYATNLSGDNALHISVNYGRIDIVNFLILEKGLDVNASNNMKSISLHIACENGYLDIAKVLISLGSKIDSINLLGYTCLHSAAKYGNMSLIKYLVNEKSCDENVRDVEGRTALDVAKEYDQEIVVNWLETRVN